MAFLSRAAARNENPGVMAGAQSIARSLRACWSGIDYVATDPTGLAAISTRTILILPAQAGEAPVPPLVPDYTASTTIPAATSSTAQ